MIIENNTVVGIHYHLTDDEGTMIDSNIGHDAFEYLHGASNIIPGLENALTGMKAGDAKKVDILPHLAYGEYDQNLIIKVQRDQIENRAEGVEPGMSLHSSEGQELYVMAVDDENVTLDANHPLAGKTLHFDVTVAGVRSATPEEIDHGHPHTPGHSHHH